MYTTPSAHSRSPAADGAHYANVAPLPPGDVEARLEMNRARLRHRLVEEQSEAQTSVWDHINQITHDAAPLARQYVRDKPAISLAAAAAAGMLLMRFKPWRALGGPLLLGMLGRHLLVAAVTRGGHLLEAVLAGTTRTKRSQPTQRL